MGNITINSFTGSVTAVPGQNTTFSVTPSANFSPVTYQYQWRVNSIPVVGATSSSYFIDPTVADNGKTFSVLVSGLSGGVLQATATSTTSILTVVSDSSKYAKFARGNESGEERYRRMHNLGYI